MVCAASALALLLAPVTRADAPARPVHAPPVPVAGSVRSAPTGASVQLAVTGRPLPRAALSYPLERTRITSPFTPTRFHPILRRTRAHRGVDFSAPAGTPVRAAAAGTVRRAGWNGDYGRHVEIDHGGGFVSAYSHLRAIPRELRTGSQVARGQLVGWVGQSGLATGPHLHFALFQDGRYVNPLPVIE